MSTNDSDSDEGGQGQTDLGSLFERTEKDGKTVLRYLRAPTQAELNAAAPLLIEPITQADMEATMQWLWDDLHEARHALQAERERVRVLEAEVAGLKDDLKVLTDGRWMVNTETMMEQLALGHQAVARVRPVLQAAIRLVVGKYHPWTNAGGPEDCEHGYTKGIPCPACDLGLVNAALEELEAQERGGVDNGADTTTA